MGRIEELGEPIRDDEPRQYHENSDRPALTYIETAYYRMLRRNQRSVKELPTQALLWEGQTHPWMV